jgi:uncharacterized protein YjdB
MRRPPRARRYALLALSVLCASCDGSSTAPSPITAVTITPSSPTLAAIGATIQLSASALRGDGQVATGETFTWTSSNNSAATVSPSGLVTAVANGSTTISATAGGVAGSTTVTVTQSASSVTVTVPNPSLSIGGTVLATATARDANNNNVPNVTFNWTSSASAVASVSSTGLVTGLTAGTTNIVASAGAATGQVAINVTDANPGPPTVTARTPGVGGADAPRNTAITVTFSEAIQQSTVTTTSFSVLGASGAVAGAISFPAANQARFTPAAPLPGLATFQVSLSGTIRDLANQALSGVTWTFATAPDPAVYYRFTNPTAAGRSLDVFSGAANICFMGTTGAFTGQYWRVVPIGDGEYFLRTLFLGNGRSLEAADGVGACQADPTGSFTGQAWRFLPASTNAIRLQSKSFGTARSLGVGATPLMQPTAETPSQYWTATAIENVGTVPPAVITHAAVQSSITGSATRFANHYTQEQISVAIVTPNRTPGGAQAIDHNHTIGVSFQAGGWSVLNQDLAAMPVGSAFNILAAGAVVGVRSFVHTATANNISQNWTVLDNALLNNQPNAIVFVTANYTPPGGPSVYNNHAIGVWYTGTRWAVFNQDQAAMPVGASFNIMVVAGSTSGYVHRSTAANIVSNYTLLDHPQLNGRADAKVTVTANFNPGGGAGVYNNHAIGVLYTGTRWAVFNQNLTAMPANAAFNIFIDEGGG